MINHQKLKTIFRPVAIIFLLSFFSPYISHGQSIEDSSKEKLRFGADINLDVAPLDFCFSTCLILNNKIGIGVSGELGVNFSNVVIMAGNRLGKDKTLFLYEDMDEYDSGRYLSLYGGSIFARFFCDKKIPVELGYKSEFFFHSVVSPNEEDTNLGFYSGPFIKAFIPSLFKEQYGRKKRNPAFGIEASFGNLNFSRYNADDELAVMASFWVRIDLDYNI